MTYVVPLSWSALEWAAALAAGLAICVLSIAMAAQLLGRKGPRR